MIRGMRAALVLALWELSVTTPSQPAGLAWTSANRYRLLLEVDPRRSPRSHSPASVDVDLAQALSAQGAQGAVDDDSIEVVAYDEAGAPRVFDAARKDGEQFLLPWRLTRDYPSSRARLSFVLPDHRSTRYAVYFDTVESGHGRPHRTRGIVGDGDRFSETPGRREIAASGYDSWGDVDGDGDLDLLKGGTEPFVFIFENLGGNRFVERGRLTSNGEPLLFPHDAGRRSWLSPEAFDWDGDGDLDLFVHFRTGPEAGQVLRYENATPPGGQLSFVSRGSLSAAGKPVLGPISFADWDGDGKTDVLSDAEGLIALHRNVGTSRAVSEMELAEGVYLQANGEPIQLDLPRADAADIDGDGDLDLFVGTDEGRVFLFENVGTRTRPVLAMGRLVAFFEYMDCRARARVADFDGDGLLDFVVGRYWERTHYGEQPRVFGRLFKNVGTARAPRFEARDADSGAPYVEGFPIADAVRQNGVRAADWDGDGKTDLIAGDTDGFVWFFRNLTGPLFPVFARGVRLTSGDAPIKAYGEEKEGRIAGYARPEVADWNNDGRLDLLLADARGWLTLYLNRGSPGKPVLAAGRRVLAGGRPIDGTSRGSAIVTDWNGDGLKDVIFAMVGEGTSRSYDWPHLSADPSNDRGFLFYKNLGSDARPLLASPKWVRVRGDAGAVIDLLRPNLGDFADWDGDGRKDFIACEFENNIRLYRNVGESAGRPRLESAKGIRVVSPSTDQTISGADVIDWNGDGDLDIVTGQGHGGSGLRFFERDYIEDSLRDSFPAVRIVGSEARVSSSAN